MVHNLTSSQFSTSLLNTTSSLQAPRGQGKCFGKSADLVGRGVAAIVSTTLATMEGLPMAAQVVMMRFCTMAIFSGACKEISQGFSKRVSRTCLPSTMARRKHDIAQSSQVVPSLTRH